MACPCPLASPTFTIHPTRCPPRRPGRFDVVLYVPPPDKEGRLQALQVKDGAGGNGSCQQERSFSVHCPALIVVFTLIGRPFSPCTLNGPAAAMPPTRCCISHALTPPHLHMCVLCRSTHALFPWRPKSTCVPLPQPQRDTLVQSWQQCVVRLP